MEDKEFEAKYDELLMSLKKKGREPSYEEILTLIENTAWPLEKRNEPPEEDRRKTTPSNKFILVYSIVSLLISLFFAWGAVSEKDFAIIFIAVPFIAIQWVIYYLIKWSIPYLKRKSPADWKAVFSTWIACLVFLMLSVFCFTGADEEDISAQYFIGSVSIAAVLATVLFSIKKMKGE